MQIFKHCNINSFSKNSRFSKFSTNCIYLTISTKTTQSTYCLKSSYNSIDSIEIFCTIDIDWNILLIIYISSTIIITNIFDNLTLINFIIAKLLIEQSFKYLDN